MATSFIIVFLLVVFSCFAPVCLSYTFADENPIRLGSDGLREDFLDDHDPSFSSLPVEAIYQFGDSISDAGNRIRDIDEPPDHCNVWPYGQALFDHPTGRCSNGLLMIDYFAKFLNLPFIDAYLNKDGNFTHGVNFAVSGSTALDVSTFVQKYNIAVYTNLSLSVQLGWFRSHLYSYYIDQSERRRKLAKGLFFMGEIGGNDYVLTIFQGKTMRNAYQIVPQVVQKIKSAVKVIIDLGATRVIIPGNFPIGCMPCYLRRFKTSDSNVYDELNCLKKYNNHAKFHNELLQQSIFELQNDHPNVAIVYMDYYGAITEILRNAASLGFDENGLQEACCGSVDKYCGTYEAPLCENPQDYMSWDGVHFTQRTYHLMAKLLMQSIVRSFRNVA